ncbi:hypothetical protein F5Y15DRAFT_371183 [Xylariaceae sp. FL0016]|nr:hypothetical protein F5Y15DRAFT_371183 [Xylariaceae sp. FL0016]
MDESLEAFRKRLDNASIITYVLMMVVVPSKIWCRTREGGTAAIRLDDYCGAFALVLANTWFYISMLGLRPYLGRHAITDIPIAGVNQFLKYLFAGSLTYAWTIAFIKFTVISFYWKLFSVTAQLPLGILVFTVFAWLVGMFFMAVFSCKPVRAQWDITIDDAQCIDQNAFYLGGSLPNVVVDFIIVFIPMPYVWRLHLSVAKRAVLVGIFALGLFVCVVSVIRLCTVMAIQRSGADATYNLREPIMWSTVEINVGLICTCLPSMRPLLKLFNPWNIFPSSQRYPPSSGPIGDRSRLTGPKEQSELSKRRRKRSPYDPSSSVLELTNVGSHGESG